MSYNALIGSESTFPSNLDFIDTKSNFTAENINTYLTNISRLNVLKAKSSLTSAEQTEFIGLLTTLKEFLISSNDWNKLGGAITNLELALTNVEQKSVQHIEKLITITTNAQTVSLGSYINENSETVDIVVDSNSTIKIIVNDGTELCQTNDYTISTDGKSIVRANSGYFYATTDDPLNFYITIDKYITE